MCLTWKWLVFCWVSKEAKRNSLASVAFGIAEIVKRTGLKERPTSDTLKAGVPNVIHNPIVSRDKIMFPPLHIRLGLMKQFVKALSLDSECFQYLLRNFTGLSYEKIKAGVFDGPQIGTLVRDQAFIPTVNVQKAAWFIFVGVMKNFFGNKKSTKVWRFSWQNAHSISWFGMQNEHQSALPSQSFRQISRRPWSCQW